MVLQSVKTTLQANPDYILELFCECGRVAPSDLTEVQHIQTIVLTIATNGKSVITSASMRCSSI